MDKRKLKRELKKAEERLNKRISRRIIELQKDKILLDRIDKEISESESLRDYLKLVHNYAKRDKVQAG